MKEEDDVKARKKKKKNRIRSLLIFVWMKELAKLLVGRSDLLICGLLSSAVTNRLNLYLIRHHLMSFKKVSR
jgi:hypothetical protein